VGGRHRIPAGTPRGLALGMRAAAPSPNAIRTTIQAGVATFVRMTPMRTQVSRDASRPGYETADGEDESSTTPLTIR
jgi:hypothetical protein